MEFVAIADFGPCLSANLINGRLIKLTELTFEP
jgi:hypothetical protein